MVQLVKGRQGHARDRLVEHKRPIINGAAGRRGAGAVPHAGPVQHSAKGAKMVVQIVKRQSSHAPDHLVEQHIPAMEMVKLFPLVQGIGEHGNGASGPLVTQNVERDNKIEEDFVALAEKRTVHQIGNDRLMLYDCSYYRL